MPDALHQTFLCTHGHLTYTLLSGTEFPFRKHKGFHTNVWDLIPFFKIHSALSKRQNKHAHTHCACEDGVKDGAQQLFLSLDSV